ncbi:MULTISPECIES: FecCD family ABC transporter permease [Clostridia]|jgi:iron complex transport system permease protein|uniref:Iron complex transport system permease protein n=3 Tax=Enterocloster citroniae TaxID=358743 RepID=A0ABV2FRF8_9FIRM|nr:MULTISPECIES: iron ABC transporter permease [Clostridia]MCB7062377.1 iron ABC transporter permease [Enterocloster citroniae]MCD8276460.1 iron ABC transporter permease [Enterocloster citroniae]
MRKDKKGKMKFRILVLVLIMLLTGLFFASFLVGTYPIPVGTVWDVLWSGITEFTPYWDPAVEKVIFQVRIPRILLGILVGGGLAVSGASYQTLFKNPMVSPDILGVSAGAGFGAALAMLGSGSWAQIQLSALVFGLAAVAAAYLIGSVYGKAEVTTLVLAGVIVSSLFQALLSVVKTYADTDSQLPSITFWLMGSLGKGDMEDVGILLPVTGVCLLILFLYRNQIDVLATGEEEAAALGVNVKLVSFLVIVTSTMMTVVSVSICGMIGWVGLVVPHITRLFTGARYSRLIAVSFLIGGFFLLLMDDIIRGANSVELPLGVLTALVGTPVFAFLLVRSRKGASQC